MQDNKTPTEEQSFNIVMNRLDEQTDGNAKKRQRPQRAAALESKQNLNNLFEQSRMARTRAAYSSDDESDDDDQICSDTSSCETYEDDEMSPIRQPNSAPADVVTALPQSAVQSNLAGGIVIYNNSRSRDSMATALAQAPAETNNNNNTDHDSIARVAQRASGSGNIVNPTAANALADSVNSPSAQWLCNQASLSVSSVFQVTLMEQIECDGVNVAVQRSRAYLGNACLINQPTSNKTWVKAANDLTKAGVNHTGSRSVPAWPPSSSKSDKHNPHRKANVMCFKNASYIALDTPSGNGKCPLHASNAPFPPVDLSIDAIISIEVIEPHRVADFYAMVDQADLMSSGTGRIIDSFINTPAGITDAAARFAGERAKAGIWTQHERTAEDVAAAINNLGKDLYSITKVLPVELEPVFARLVENNFNYNLEMPLDQKAAAIFSLEAIPSTNLRELPGNHSQSKRLAFQRTQLAGVVCTPNSTSSSATRPAPHPPGSQEAVAKRVKQVLHLVQSGRGSAASKILFRSEAPQKPIEEVLSNLTPLHPRGDPPREVPLPAVPLYSRESVTVAAIRRIVKRSCKETAPGPDKWTQELLNAALTHSASFAESFRCFIIDICNASIPGETIGALALSTLLGINKDDGGTRPLAMGETFLKIADTVALEREQKNLAAANNVNQKGTGAPNGGESIIHAARDFAENGTRPHSSIISGENRLQFNLDYRNAFNSITRDAMLDGILDYNIEGLLGTYKVAYQQHAQLIVAGSGGTACIESQTGARQGTAPGSHIFALVIQPAADKIREEHEHVDLLLYLDDASGFADDPLSAHNALVEIDTYSTSKGLTLNRKKCEIFMPGLATPGMTAAEYTERVIHALDEAGVPAESPLREFRISKCVKLLGASIGVCREEEAEHLYAREKPKIDAKMERIRQLPASPFFFFFFFLFLVLQAITR